MGCGQSKIGIYQRKSKSKKNGGKRSGEGGDSEDEAEEAEDRVGEEAKEGVAEEGAEVGEGDSVADPVTSKIKQLAQQPTGGAILAQSDISSSQLDFFKMLDEKIENGPDYEDDEEEENIRLRSLVEEWKMASTMVQDLRNGHAIRDQSWPSPTRGSYGSYPGRTAIPLDTQRFPTGYSQCPPPSGIAIHLQNTFRVPGPPHPDQMRLPPQAQLARAPFIGTTYHPYQMPPDGLKQGGYPSHPNHMEDSSQGHPMSCAEPPNPLRANFPQVIMRQNSLQHYPESQRLYADSVVMRQFPDAQRFQDQRQQYTIPRNVMHDQRVYMQDPGRPYPYHDPQRMLPDNQRMYHERLLENQRQEGQRPHPSFQRPPLLTQRSFQEPPRIYRDLDGEEQCYQRQDRFTESLPGDPSQAQSDRSRIPNPIQNSFKVGRSLSVDMQYVSSPPPPREMVPLQGSPGPPLPQGSPRPMMVRGPGVTAMQRPPVNSVVQFRKSRGAFTELA